MVKEKSLPMTKAKGRKPANGKTARRAADDAAKKAQKTEQKYDEKHGMFTK